MPNSLISFESWLSQFTNQELADQVRRIVGDDYLKSPEEFIWDAIAAYRKAQENHNLNPELLAILETVSSPIIGTLVDTENPIIKTQKISYTVIFVSELEIASAGITGWLKPKS